METVHSFAGSTSSTASQGSSSSKQHQVIIIFCKSHEHAFAPIMWNKIDNTALYTLIILQFYYSIDISDYEIDSNLKTKNRLTITIIDSVLEALM